MLWLMVISSDCCICVHRPFFPRARKRQAVYTYLWMLSSRQGESGAVVRGVLIFNIPLGSSDVDLLIVSGLFVSSWTSTSRGIWRAVKLMLQLLASLMWKSVTVLTEILMYSIWHLINVQIVVVHIFIRSTGGCVLLGKAYTKLLLHVSTIDRAQRRA